MFSIQLSSNWFEYFDFQSIFCILALFIAAFFSFEKLRSMGAISGLYWGIKTTLKPMLSIFSIVVFDRCIEALSSITRHLWRPIFSSSSINFASTFKKSTNNSELIDPKDIAEITLPVENIAVTKDHEFLKVMLFTIWSLPFGIQEKSFFVNRVKDD